MKKIFKISLLFVTLFPTLSCHKDREQFQNCNKECMDIKIKGQVKNMETNTGISNFLVSVRWKNSEPCFLCFDNKNIAQVKTDNLGNFSFNIAVDSSLFNEKHIEVFIPTDNNNFFYTPDSGRNPTTEFDILSGGSYEFKFEVFPKATLTLKIKHNSHNLTGAEISHSFHKGGVVDYSWFKNSNSVQQDTIQRVSTASGLMTRINWRKWFGVGNYINFQDSLRCEKGKENVFEIVL